MNKSNAFCGIIFGLGLPDVVQRGPGLWLRQLWQAIEHVLDFALTATLLAGLRIHFVQRGPEPHGTVPNGQLGGIHSSAFEAEQNLAPTQASLNDMDDATENSTVVHTPDTPCLGNNY